MPASESVKPRPESPDAGLASTLIFAVWLGVLAGIVEGLGLLAFQHINWQRWGPMIHVSGKILWISPIVDVAFFVVVSALVWLLMQLIRPTKSGHAVVFVLSFLSAYDWLSITARLDRRACGLLALGVSFAIFRWFSAHLNVRRFCRRTVSLAVLLLVLTFVAIEGGTRLAERKAIANLPPAANDAPNVLVIVVDTLRGDHVSSAGYARPTTPNLDNLSRQGVTFENAIAPCSWSLPSHVSLLTGRYLYEHGVGNVQREPWLGWGTRGLGGFVSLAEALENRGYRTGAFSANRTYFSHDLGFGRGFVHFEDYFHSPADMFVRTFYGREFARIYLIRSEKSLVKRMLRSLGMTSLLDQDAEGSGSYGGAFGIRKRADVINNELLQWLDKSQSRPFFAFLNYFDVHDPYGAPRAYVNLPWQQLTEVDRYDAGIRFTDDYLGRLLKGLDARGQLQNTLVIVTSDHGESLGQHHLQTHGRALYRELIQVPLIFWFPNRIPAGVRVPQPVTNAAIPATVMSLLTNDNATFPGPSLDRLWKTPSPDTWPNPLSELAEHKYPGKNDREADRL